MRDNGAVTSASADPDAVSQADRGAAPARRRRVVLFGAVAAVALTLDIVSKVLVAASLDNHPPVRLLGGALYLVETRNSGAAFSVGTGATVALTVVALVVVAIILRTARRMYSVGWAVALGLILGGALGNIVDRLFRAPGVGRGHVVDWISLFASDGHVWPTFNLADSAIVCGALLAAAVALLGIELDGSRDGRQPARGQ
jgi:signal peptidase II